MNPNQTQRIEMTPEQAKAFAAELRAQARIIEGFAKSVTTSSDPDAYVYVAIAKCVPVRIRIGKEQGVPELKVGARVKVDYPGDGVVGPITWYGVVESMLESSCMVRSDHSNTCPNVLKQYITVLPASRD